VATHSRDEAYREIAERIQSVTDEIGAEGIWVGTGTGRHHFAFVSRFANAIGTPNWCEPGTAQCFRPRVHGSVLTMGQLPICTYTEDVFPELILFWGHNPIYSGPDGELGFGVKEALARKPKTIVVDPRETLLAKRADIWLQLRPGTDDALALAMLHVIIEEGLQDQDFVDQWTHGFDELAERVADYTPEWAAPITWVAADKIGRRRACMAKCALPCWNGAAPLSIRPIVFRPCARFCACPRSPAISISREAGRSACRRCRRSRNCSRPWMRNRRKSGLALSSTRC
jgi:anaerobic selenocysteine-containing dehydrogenase